MKQVGLTRAELIISVVVTLIFTGLCTFGMISYVNRDNVWVPIVNPTQEKAVEFVAVSRLLQPYVRTDRGNFYFCSGNTWQDTCRPVAEIDLPLIRIPGRWQTCRPVFPPLPPLAGQPINTLDLGQCQEGRTYARLVILADGTIWKWRRSFSWVNAFAVGSVAVASLVVGLLLAIALLRLRRYLRTPIPGSTTGSRAG